MLRTRLWVGTVLVALTVLALVADRGPAYPILFALVEFLALISCFELLRLLPSGRRPSSWLCSVAIFLVIASNWWPAFAVTGASLPTLWFFAASVMAAFLVEMASFRRSGESLERIALAVLLVAYLGVLPSFLVRLRWFGPTQSSAPINPGVIALALAIFVPKCCDIGAYFTGRLLGRHRMAPLLSPKKTWEGAAGGLAVAVVAAIGIDRLSPVLGNAAREVGFGLSVGVAGMIGDLAESLIKRDLRQKDASQVVPGFGGVLDVVDAILFAAPVAYLWLRTDGWPLT